MSSGEGREMIDRRTFLAGAAAIAAAPLDVIARDVRSDLLLTDAIVLTMDGMRRAFRSGYVWIRGERIHRVGSMRELGDVPRGIKRRRLSGRLIMPGLMTCQTHLASGMTRGGYAGTPLKDWYASGLWPVHAAFDPKTAGSGANVSLRELLSNGVTTTAVGEIGSRYPDRLDGVLT